MININLDNHIFKILIITIILISVTSFSFAQDAFENLKIPTDVKDLLNNFSKIEYDIKTLENGEKSSEANIKYNYLGKEKINNTQSDKISIEITDKIQEDLPSKIYFWFSDNDIKQMQIDENILSENMAKMMSDKMLSAIFYPLKQLSQFNMEEFKKIGKVTKEKDIYSGQEITITKIEVRNIPELELEYGMTKIAEFENISVVLKYEYISSKYDRKVEFEVKEFELH